tara:strand:+ start:375 stop:545 length:171 start_codon:yes stop_codon:yes gene_type:complete
MKILAIIALTTFVTGCAGIKKCNDDWWKAEQDDNGTQLHDETVPDGVSPFVWLFFL